MTHFRKYGLGLGLAVGLLVGLVLGGLWPHAPIHATATDRSEDYALATGFVDQENEAVFYLDYLTGKLTGAVLSRKSLTFQATFFADVGKDLEGASVQMPQKPNFLMVTGTTNLVNTGRPTLGNTIVYVLETNTGVILAYAVPWQRELFSADKPFYMQPMQLRARQQFGSTLLRQE